MLEHPEVRDVLAWLRLLVDPHDAAAVVRALARPPIELRQVHLARVIQLARRRRLDLVSGLAAATESPQLPPEARDRIQRFLTVHESACAGLDVLSGEVFIASLIDLLGRRAYPLLAPEDAAEQRDSLERLRELALEFARSQPGCSARELARHLVTVAAGGREAQPGERAAPEADELAHGELQATLQLMRQEVIASVARIGERLGELRLDTDLDVSHGVVRYLELLKVAALLQRPSEQSMADALADINARLMTAATPLQREIFETSPLDDALRGAFDAAAEPAPGEETEAWRYARARAQAIVPREGPSLGTFLPRKGLGLALSASDIETYRSCPLRYKFARVLRVPSEQTLHQRFGIAVHQVLERFHAGSGQTLAQMLELLDDGWRRSGLGDGERERRLREKARTALTRYHARLYDASSRPVWFERSFSFRLGPHHLRGRVDRVDRLVGEAGEQYELIDYKTSRPKTAAQLKDDVQLSLYALAARAAWQLESSRQAYYYVLDDRKVPVPAGDGEPDKIADTVLEVGEGILAQEFEPTPSRASCSICDYRIACPAAEVG
jgi:DNA helicase-2/ATP-dependent DNA helicase PcrA